MLAAIPIFDGPTLSFYEFYRNSVRQIGRVAQNHILFLNTGNPRYSDEWYKGMCTPEQAEKDRQLRGQWETDFPTSEAEMDQRIRECLDYSEEYDLDDSDLPCIVFLTQATHRIGLLRVADHWYDSESSWRVFVRCFCAWLGSKDFKKLATADLADAAIERRLSRLLRTLSQAINGQLQESKSVNETTEEHQIPSSVHYKVLTEKGTEHLTLEQYNRLAGEQSKYDMFIDSVTRRASYRDIGGRSNVSRLTPRELAILLEYIQSRRVMRPVETKICKPNGSFRAANNLFADARRKVDVALRRFEYRSFRLVRHPLGSEYRAHQFAPRDDLTYRIILLP